MIIKKKLSYQDFNVSFEVDTDTAEPHLTKLCSSNEFNQETLLMCNNNVIEAGLRIITFYLFNLTNRGYEEIEAINKFFKHEKLNLDESTGIRLKNFVYPEISEMDLEYSDIPEKEV